MCRIQSSVPIRIAEKPAENIAGSNPLLQSYGTPTFKNNAKTRLQELKTNRVFTVRFLAVKGKSYTIIPVE